jgi:hypothetical protein
MRLGCDSYRMPNGGQPMPGYYLEVSAKTRQSMTYLVMSTVKSLSMSDPMKTSLISK